MRVLAGALETESRSAENRRKETERASKRPTLSKPRSIQTSQALTDPLPSPQIFSCSRPLHQCLPLQLNLLPLNINGQLQLRRLHPTVPRPRKPHPKASTNPNPTSKNFRILSSVS